MEDSKRFADSQGAFSRLRHYQMYGIDDDDVSVQEHEGFTIAAHLWQVIVGTNARVEKQRLPSQPQQQRTARLRHAAQAKADGGSPEYASDAVDVALQNTLVESFMMSAYAVASLES